MAINSIGTEMWFIDNSTLVKLDALQISAALAQSAKAKKALLCLETGLTQTFTGALK